MSTRVISAPPARRRPSRGASWRTVEDVSAPGEWRQPVEWIGIASRREEVLEALSLVHGTYVRNGLMSANRFGVRVTRYHALPTTEIVIVTRDRQVASTMTIVRDGDLGLPLEEIYHEEVSRRRRQGIRLAEVGCLASGKDDEDGALRSLVRLMSLTAQLSRFRGVDELLIAVHPRHAAFYERFLAFRLVGEERVYGSIRDKPAVLLALDLNWLARMRCRAHDRLFGEPFPTHILYRRPLHTRLRQELSYLARFCEIEADHGNLEEPLQPVTVMHGDRGSRGISAA